MTVEVTPVDDIAGHSLGHFGTSSYARQVPPRVMRRDDDHTHVEHMHGVHFRVARIAPCQERLLLVRRQPRSDTVFVGEPTEAHEYVGAILEE